MKTPAIEITSYARKKIINTLNSLGVPSNMIGYECLKEGVEVLLINPEAIRKVTKNLYPVVAANLGTTPSRAERAMRHAIETTFNRSDMELLQEWFGPCVSPDTGKLTNSEFLSLTAEKIRLELGVYDA